MPFKKWIWLEKMISVTSANWPPSRIWGISHTADLILQSSQHTIKALSKISYHYRKYRDIVFGQYHTPRLEVYRTSRRCVCLFCRCWSALDISARALSRRHHHHRHHHEGGGAPRRSPGQQQQRIMGTDTHCTSTLGPLTEIKWVQAELLKKLNYF